MIAQFALRLVGGISLMWSLMPRTEVTAGFFRIQMLVVLGFSVLGCVTWESPPAPDVNVVTGWLVENGKWVNGALAAAAFVGSIFWTLVWRKTGDAFCIGIACVSNILLIAVAVEQFAGSATAVFAELSTSASLGAVMTGMLLGHWYLTAPTMSIAPLSRLNQFVLVAALCRLTASAVVFATDSNLLLSQTQWMWLSLRWLAGIMGPVAVGIMVIRILRYRNTQSATGVLFVGVILSFIGEMSAALLAQELGAPF